VPLVVISMIASYASYAAPATVIVPVLEPARAGVTEPAAPAVAPVRRMPHTGPPPTSSM
jgi:hypothetical protein